MTANENRQPAVQPRRIRFNYPVAALDRHFVQGDLVMSHMIAHLSAVFPPGEDFFIRSVRRYADQITDPGLKEQVKGFIGQEVTHGREHRALNERLQEMGYPTRRVAQLVDRRQQAIERRFSPLTCLAITAALEHFTAVFAETLLSDEKAQEVLGTSEVRSMLLWHAIEESEHRAVAFDVYRAVGGGETRRIRTMRIIRFSFPLAVVINTLISLFGDRAAYHPVRLFRSFAALRHSPFLTRAVFSRLGEYMQPGFHPNDRDNTDLLEHWEAKLFGEQGSLVDHLN
ncbi:metal-dependent hydrolase [Mycolicibacter nonchromogenicus]|uniref:Metal-dependent hydrolase n=1 Tax=Mycolicibacter nonchromogenicus TaxID=1782 RepID=A0A1X1ZBC0_MYCNO|nr:metal-dependent hydrolase [Mycolicibacter nonchromogenicus]OMC08123.1 metal-dependent hydrolase [Mycolicibacter heraklionensis]ORW20622.1 metal-dependent hydrolase [Mycolicibacter nonchromogenicus]